MLNFGFDINISFMISPVATHKKVLFALWVAASSSEGLITHEKEM